MSDCSTKDKYRTKAEAKTARRRTGRGSLRAYFCDAHQCWHLGTLAPTIVRGQESREVYE